MPDMPMTCSSYRYVPSGISPCPSVAGLNSTGSPALKLLRRWKSSGPLMIMSMLACKPMASTGSKIKPSGSTWLSYSVISWAVAQAQAAVIAAASMVMRIVFGLFIFPAPRGVHLRPLGRFFSSFSRPGDRSYNFLIRSDAMPPDLRPVCQCVHAQCDHQQAEQEQPRRAEQRHRQRADYGQFGTGAAAVAQAGGQFAADVAQGAGEAGDDVDLDPAHGALDDRAGGHLDQVRVRPCYARSAAAVGEGGRRGDGH